MDWVLAAGRVIGEWKFFPLISDGEEERERGWVEEKPWRLLFFNWVSQTLTF